MIARAVSRNVIRTQAKRYGWTVEQKSPTRLTVRKRL